jgi:hypothetical protein
MLLQKNPQAQGRLLLDVRLALHEHLKRLFLRCLHHQAVLAAQVCSDIPSRPALQRIRAVPLKVVPHADVASDFVILLAQKELQAFDFHDGQLRLQWERRNRPQWTFRRLILVGGTVAIEIVSLSRWGATIVIKAACLVIATIDVISQAITVAIWSATVRGALVLWPSWLVGTDVVPIANPVPISVGTPVQFRQTWLSRAVVSSVADTVAIQVRATVEFTETWLSRALV